MKTILLQNGHEMYEDAFHSKVDYIIKSLEENGCEVVDSILTKHSDNTLPVDFTLLIDNYDDMKLRDTVANYYVEYSIEEESSHDGLTITHFKFK